MSTALADPSHPSLDLNKEAVSAFTLLFMWLLSERYQSQSKVRTEGYLACIQWSKTKILHTLSPLLHVKHSGHVEVQPSCSSTLSVSVVLHQPREDDCIRSKDRQCSVHQWQGSRVPSWDRYEAHDRAIMTGSACGHCMALPTHLSCSMHAPWPWPPPAEQSDCWGHLSRLGEGRGRPL